MANAEGDDQDSMSLSNVYVPKESVWSEFQFDARFGSEMFIAGHLARELLDSLNQPQFTGNGRIKFIAHENPRVAPGMVSIHACNIDPIQERTITKEHIEGAISYSNQGQFVIDLQLDQIGSERSGRLSLENIGRTLAIVINGRIIMAPVVNDCIRDGRIQISGDFTESEAEELASILSRGTATLPRKVLSIKAI